MHAGEYRGAGKAVRHAAAVEALERLRPPADLALRYGESRAGGFVDRHRLNSDASGAIAHLGDVISPAVPNERYRAAAWDLPRRRCI